jgi:hypothetical protein
VQRAVPVAPRALLGFGFAVHSSPATDDHLHVFGGAGQAYRQQPLFRFRRRNTSQRSYLRIRQLTAGQRLSKPWQCSERACYTDMLTGSAQREPHTPGKPVGA